VLPDEVAVELEPLTWPIPEVFSWLLRAGRLSVPETLRTFNCGIGMALVTAPERAEALSRLLVETGERVHVIGRIVERPAGGPGLRPDPREIRWPD
jgi:phosphoribosylformylglycinamidine cyclo-ligase